MFYISLCHCRGRLRVNDNRLAVTLHLQRFAAQASCFSSVNLPVQRTIQLITKRYQSMQTSPASSAAMMTR